MTPHLTSSTISLSPQLPAADSENCSFQWRTPNQCPKAVLDLPRNKSDRVLKEVAARGGTVGASIHCFLCWDGNSQRRHTLSDFVTHINYLRDLVGIDSIAMGTDFPAVSS